MRPKSQSGLRLILAASFLLSLAVIAPVQAQATGDTIEFLIAEQFAQPKPPARVGDAIVVTGRSLGTVDIAGCGLGERSVQQAILVDREAGRASHRIEIVMTSHAGELSPGIRIASVSPTGMCTAGGTGYYRYHGTLR